MANPGGSGYLADELEDNEEQARFAVEKVVDTRIGKGGRRYYKVRWVDSWEPEENLDGCYELIQAFWDEFHQTKKGRSHGQKSKRSESDDGSLPECPFKVNPTNAGNEEALLPASEAIKSDVDEPLDLRSRVDAQVDVHLQSKAAEVGAPRTKRHLQSRYGGKDSDSAEGSKDESSSPNVRTGSKGVKINQEKKERLLERLKQKKHDFNPEKPGSAVFERPKRKERDVQTAGRDSLCSPGSSSNVRVKEEPASSAEEEEELLKRTAKLKASFIIKRYLELEGNYSEEECEDDDGLSGGFGDKRQVPSGNKAAIVKAASVINASPVRRTLESVTQSAANSALTSGLSSVSGPSAAPVVSSPLPVLRMISAARARPEDVSEANLLSTFTNELEERVKLKQSELLKAGRDYVGVIEYGVNPGLPNSPSNSRSLYLSVLEQMADEKALNFCAGGSGAPVGQDVLKAKSKDLYRKMLSVLMTSRKLIATPGISFDATPVAPPTSLRKPTPPAPQACLNLVNPGSEPIFGTDITINVPSNMANSFLNPSDVTPTPSTPGLSNARRSASSASTVAAAAVLPHSAGTAADRQELLLSFPQAADNPPGTFPSNSDEIQITKSVGIMPTINLPNGRRLKLVPDGNVPENVKKYVQDNYDRILKDIADSKEPNLINRRLLVHPDGTMEVSPAVPSRSAPSSASEPEVIDLLDDNDAENELPALALARSASSDSVSTRPKLVSAPESLPTVGQAVSFRHVSDGSRVEYPPALSSQVFPPHQTRLPTNIVVQNSAMMEPHFILASPNAQQSADGTAATFHRQFPYPIRPSDARFPLYDAAQHVAYARLHGASAGLGALPTYVERGTVPVVHPHWQAGMPAAFLHARNGFVPPLLFDAPQLTPQSRFINGVARAPSGPGIVENRMAVSSVQVSAKGWLPPNPPHPPPTVKRQGAALPSPPQSQKRVRTVFPATVAQLRDGGVVVSCCTTPKVSEAIVACTVSLAVSSATYSNLSAVDPLPIANGEGANTDDLTQLSMEGNLRADSTGTTPASIFTDVLCEDVTGSTAPSRDVFTAAFPGIKGPCESDVIGEPTGTTGCADYKKACSSESESSSLSWLTNLPCPLSLDQPGVDGGDGGVPFTQTSAELKNGTGIAVSNPSLDGLPMYSPPKELQASPQECKRTIRASPILRRAGRKVNVSVRWSYPYELATALTPSWKRLLCAKCGRRFLYRELLAKHRFMQHRRRLRISCFYCREKCFGIAELKAHLRTSHPHIRKNLCKNCGRCFEFEFDYGNHCFGVHKKRSYRCRVCNEKFVSRLTGRIHAKTRHSASLRKAKWKFAAAIQRLSGKRVRTSPEAELLPNLGGVLRSHCRTCRKPFLSLDHLTQHEKLHCRKIPQSASSKLLLRPRHLWMPAWESGALVRRLGVAVSLRRPRAILNSDVESHGASNST